MRQDLLIGTGAGLASALMTIAVAAGSPLAFPLAMFSPLPIVLASLGWGTRASIAAALSGTVVVGLVLTPLYGLVFLVTSAAPTAFLAFLVGLARSDGGRLEWYPLGRILTLSAVINGGILLLISVFTGMNEKAVGDLLFAFQKELMAQSGTGVSLSDAQLRGYVDNAVAKLPILASGAAVAFSVVNLWLGAWIIRRSDRLSRPWVKLATCEIPPQVALVFLAVLVAGLIPGGVGHFVGYLTGAIGMAFMLIGLSVLHTVTHGIPARTLILIAAYGSILVTLQTYMLASLLFTALGWAETFLGIRQRRTPPPRPGNGMAPD